ncbi:carbonic anhydrase [Ovoidimarina sediminis]|uniref:carbonic anhydrase n=1 Tax=Ovoidimarina sediminis TaxID=3079856 RepID=UPI00290DDAE2|nr:carbonic anhydrase [Rhodophyticola sp. MJ-SS7]MDU8944483.1 carbonic anhydrase [Rhodophyticola sp. MJ-SS7]
MVHRAQILPKRLQVRYRIWLETIHAAQKIQFRALADLGQDPLEMVIACCDSRVHVTSIFGAASGEMFVHRNVAALVPPYEPDGAHHGTSAAIEYAVQVLKVRHIIVMGHSQCGGVEGCYQMCSGHAPDLLEQASFVGRWMDLLRPGYERLPEDAPEEDRIRRLEKEAVLVSIENLLTYPFVVEAVESGRTGVHGLWIDIGDGRMEAYDPASRSFVSI